MVENSEFINKTIKFWKKMEKMQL